MQKKKNKKNPVLYLIKKFGGLRAAAREIGRAPSGIHRWKVDRAIPKSALPLIFKAAKRNGLTLWERRLK